MIEVLVAILVLSFGMLAIAGIQSYAVQLPKISGFRAMASNLAMGHIEKMRANKVGFANGSYDETLSYDGTNNTIALQDCAYPSCTASTLAAMDRAATNNALRTALPAGGMRMVRDNGAGVPSTTTGNLWVIWNEPETFAALNPSNVDNCPAEVASFTRPKPRCLYIRFTL